MQNRRMIIIFKLISWAAYVNTYIRLVSAAFIRYPRVTTSYRQ